MHRQRLAKLPKLDVRFLSVSSNVLAQPALGAKSSLHLCTMRRRGRASVGLTAFLSELWGLKECIPFPVKSPTTRPVRLDIYLIPISHRSTIRIISTRKNSDLSKKGVQAMERHEGVLEFRAGRSANQTLEFLRPLAYAYALID